MKDNSKSDKNNRKRKSRAKENLDNNGVSNDVSKDDNPDAVNDGARNKSDRDDIDLDNPEFQNAWKLLNYTTRSVFLTGKAGTGKSTFLRYIVKHLRKRVVVLAPTGIAAVNVGGQTLHSFFKIPLKPILPDDPEFAIGKLRRRMKYSSSQVKILQKLDVIIIDEISMVRADIIDFIDKILRVYNQNMREPFGGKQLLLVGDVFQLEPVVTGDARDILSNYYTAPYFFNAFSFRNLSIVPIELRKVYRQTDDTFVALLDRVRAGEPTDDDIALLNAKLDVNAAVAQNAKGSAMTMTIATRRDMVDHINEKHLEALKTPLQTYVGIIDRDFPQNSLPTDIELHLKVGAQIVFIKNDPERRWVNGTLGVVEELHEDEIKVRLEDGSMVTVKEEIWANVKYVYNAKTKTVDEIELGTFRQLPVKAAWALTIHKSQGVTFNKVIIDIGQGAFASGQAYVALSRCRSLEGITMCSTINKRDVFVNRAVVNFSRSFNDKRLITEAVDSARADDLYHRSAVAFEQGNISEAVELFAQAVATRNDTQKPLLRRIVTQKLMVIDKMKREIDDLHRQLDEARSVVNDIADHHISLGVECMESGENEAALAFFEKACNLSPNNFEAHLNFALVASELGDTDRALEALEKATRENPEDIRVYITAGDIYDAIGDPMSAMEHYLHAYDINPKSEAVLRRIVKIYKDVGDEETSAYYRKILDDIKNRRNI